MTHKITEPLSDAQIYDAITMARIMVRQKRDQRAKLDREIETLERMTRIAHAVRRVAKVPYQDAGEPLVALFVGIELCDCRMPGCPDCDNQHRAAATHVVSLCPKCGARIYADELECPECNPPLDSRER